MSKSNATEKPTGKPKQPEAITEPPQFERALEELEGLVDRLEGEDLTLEESLAVFERGIGLTRTCQQALDAAEQRVRILTEQSDSAEPEPFSDRVAAPSED
jgi:exodeoxyribonuclease VII small subunit